MVAWAPTVARAACLLLLVAAAQALPSGMPRRSRRSLQAAQAPSPSADGLAVSTLLFVSACEGSGVDFRVHLLFDGAYDWFGPETTDAIPRPFPDYFCDNIGEVGFQYGDETNRVDDPQVQAALAEGVCYNDQVFLRPPGWRGRGPQATLDLQYPNGTVSDVYVSVQGDGDGEEASGEAVVPASYEEAVWRTADAALEACEPGSQGCARFYKVSLEEPVEFVCVEDGPAPIGDEQGVARR